MRIKFQSYTIIICALEIIVGLFYMGTWGNKVTKVIADLWYHVKEFRLNLESIRKTQIFNRMT